MNSIAKDHRRPVRFMAASFVALGYQVRMGVRTVGDFIERRFAEFAGVPHSKRRPLLDMHARRLMGSGQISRPIFGEGADNKPLYRVVRLRGPGVEYFGWIAAICLKMTRILSDRLPQT